MRGLTMKTTVVVAVNLTADQWELYSMEPGADDAAIALNRAVEAAVNTSGSALEAMRKVDASGVFKKYEDLGARDSEPLYHLDSILDRAFGGWK